MAVPIPSILDILGPALPLIAVVLALFVAVKIGPPIVGRLRQRSYDTLAAAEAQRLEVSIGRGRTGSADAAVALIRGLHPQRRLGADGWWPRGWPGFELRTIWRDGRLHWQIDAGRDILPLVEVGLASAYPGAEVRRVARRDSPAVWSAIARLRLPSSRPLGDPSAGGAVLSRLASLLVSTSTPSAEVRYRVVVRPIDPKAWQHALYPEAAGRSITSYALSAAPSTGVSESDMSKLREAHVGAVAAPGTLIRG